MIETTVDDRGVATLRLARPDKHNALSEDLIAGLRQAADQLGADPQVRVVILAAAGPSFCAGGDLGWMRAQMAADAATRKQAASALAAMLGALNRMPKPLIGRIHGDAFGGGVGLACVCDVAIGAGTARFGLTETRLGLIPATIGPYVVARMGAGRARRVFMSSRRFDAQEARALGVLAQVVDPDGLDAAIEQQVVPYLACAPGAVAAAKALALDLGQGVNEAAISASIDALITQWDSPEAAEGIGAFFDKRRPNWAVR